MTERTINELILDTLIIRQIYLLRFSTYLSNKLISIVQGTNDDVGRLIRDELSRMPKGVRTQAEWEKLKTLADRVSMIRRSAFELATTEVVAQLDQLAADESESLKATYESPLPVDVNFAIPSILTLALAIRARPFQGLTVTQWLERASKEDDRKVRAALNAGATAGEAADKVARRVVGSTRVAGVDGATHAAGRDLATIVRTAVQHTTSETRKEFNIVNKTVMLETEIFAAVLDGHTTALCRSLDGNRYKPGEGPYPPLHMGCRSLRYAVLDGKAIKRFPLKPKVDEQWRKIFKHKFAGDTSETGYALWVQQRVERMTGAAPEPEVYSAWFAKQTASIQNSILGATKARLYRAGDMKLDKFVDYTGREYSLKELSERMPDVFKRAGLNPKDF